MNDDSRKPQTRRVSHQKPIRSPKPAEDCTKNWFEAQNEGRRTPKTNLKPKMTLGFDQKSI